jgi:hypothetical protein
MYGKRHPLSGATYQAGEDGSVRVVARDGTCGVFSADGRWIEGALRYADPHLCGWVAGPRIGSPAAPARSQTDTHAPRTGPAERAGDRGPRG